jgi:hypothetical protein
MIITFQNRITQKPIKTEMTDRTQTLLFSFEREKKKTALSPVGIQKIAFLHFKD